MLLAPKSIANSVLSITIPPLVFRSTLNSFPTLRSKPSPAVYAVAPGEAQDPSPRQNVDALALVPLSNAVTGTLDNPNAIVPAPVTGEPLSTSIPSLPVTATLVTVPVPAKTHSFPLHTTKG